MTRLTGVATVFIRYTRMKRNICVLGSAASIHMFFRQVADKIYAGVQLLIQFEGSSPVKHMHAVSLLIHPNFSSNLMPPFVGKLTFDPLSNCSKSRFWTIFICSNWIKSEFLNISRHVTI